MQIKFKPWTPHGVTLDKMPSYTPAIVSQHPFRNQMVAMVVGRGAYSVTADGKMGDYICEADECTVLDATATPTHSGDLPPGVWFEVKHSPPGRPNVWQKTDNESILVSINGHAWTVVPKQLTITRILGTLEVEDANR